MNTFYTTLIVLGIIFLLIGIIFVPLFIRGRKKDRVLRGKKEHEKKKKKENGDSIITKAKEKWKSNRNTILIGGFSYITLHVALATLLPKVWAVYWGHHDFFLIFQVYMAMIIATIWLDIWSVKWFLRTAFTIIVVVYMSIEFKPSPPPNDTETESSYGQTYTQQKQETTRGGVETLYIVAPANGKWSEIIDVPDGYDAICDKDPSCGLSNMDKLIAARVNGKEVIAEERLPDGRIADISKPKAKAKFIQITCLEKTSAQCTISFPKRK